MRLFETFLHQKIARGFRQSTKLPYLCPPNEHSIENMGGTEQLAEKKKAILESTLELIKENGFHGTPMSLVAKEAGVAAGTIYHYFDSKERLICELYTYENRQRMEAVAQGDDASLSYPERFFAIWLRLFNYYRDNPNVLQFFEQFVNSPYHVKNPEESHDGFYGMLFGFFAKGIEEGYLRPANPEILGVLAHGSVITTAKIHRYGKINLGENDLRQIAQIMWDGMSIK